MNDLIVPSPSVIGCGRSSPFARVNRTSPGPVASRDLDHPAAHLHAESGTEAARGLAERSVIGDQEQASAALDPPPNLGDLGRSEGWSAPFPAEAGSEG